MVGLVASRLAAPLLIVAVSRIRIRPLFDSRAICAGSCGFSGSGLEGVGDSMWPLISINALALSEMSAVVMVIEPPLADMTSYLYLESAGYHAFHPQSRSFQLMIIGKRNEAIS